jgi:GlpG protein
MEETSEVVSESPDPAFKKFLPVVTGICCIASIVLFIGINCEDVPYVWDVYRKWGSPSMDDIFEGSYWGLVTTNFLHVDLWHIAFNLYWIWIFGKAIEFETSRLFYVLLILSSALISSVSQISISENTGIGLSGIAYSFFGFLLQKSKKEDAFKKYLTKPTINLFIFWLFACIFLTQTKILNVANGAHFGGFIWGMLLGYISRFGIVKQWLIGAAMLLVMSSAIFWSPFSTAWLSYRAHLYHNDQKVEEAMKLYQKVLDRYPDDADAIDNLRLLQIHKLQKKAFDLHAKKEYDEARKLYKEILEMDPGNAWALESMGDLPKE